MGAGAGLGVALEAEGRRVGELDALQRAVEQRHVGDAHPGGQRVGIHRKAMVLTGDADAASVEVLDRVVGAVVAELHLDGASTDSEAQQLVPQADAEERHLAIEEGAQRVDGVGAGFRITRTVGEEDAVGFHGQHVGRRRGGRHDGHVAALVGQQAQDVALGAEVVGDDAQASAVRTRCLFVRLGAMTVGERPAALFPDIGLLHADFLGQIHAGQAGEGTCCSQGGIDVERRIDIGSGHQTAALGAALAQQPGEPAGVDADQADLAVFLEKVRQRLLGSPAGDLLWQRPDDETSDVQRHRFHVFGVGAGVADLGGGERDDLSCVAWVRQNFLVAGHGGVEDHLSGGKPRRTEGISRKHGPVRKNESRTGQLRSKWIRHIPPGR